jgi:hypothetical protein
MSAASKVVKHKSKWLHWSKNDECLVKRQKVYYWRKSQAWPKRQQRERVKRESLYLERERERERESLYFYLERERRCESISSLHSPLLSYADVCWRMLTYAARASQASTRLSSHTRPYADVCWHTLHVHLKPPLDPPLTRWRKLFSRTMPHTSASRYHHIGSQLAYFLLTHSYATSNVLPHT